MTIAEEEEEQRPRVAFEGVPIGQQPELRDWERRDKYDKMESIAKVVFVACAFVWVITWVGILDYGRLRTVRITKPVVLRSAASASATIVARSVVNDEILETKPGIPVPLPEGEEGADDGPAELPLTQDGWSFHWIMKHNKYVLVNYYAHWCKWSQRFRPEWDRLMAGEGIAARDVALLEINCEVHQELCRQERVYAFPTIRFYQDGAYVRSTPEYKGDRTVKGLNSFIQRRLSGIVDDGSQDRTDFDKVVMQSEDGDDDRKEEGPPEEDEEYVSREGKNLDKLLPKHKHVFVDFMAPWCRWCQRLNPIWNQLSDSGFKDVLILKVDCVENSDLCRKHKIMSFPTLRLFKDGEPVTPDYKMDRTLVALRSYLVSAVSSDYGVPFDAAASAIRLPVAKPPTRLKLPGSSDKLGTASSSASAAAVSSNNWDLDVEYAVRARNLEKLFTGSENVILAFTDSKCHECASFRPTWNTFARDTHQSALGKKLIVAEIDCAVDNCPQYNKLEYPYYQWYHQGDPLGREVMCGGQTTVDSLMNTAEMMLDMEQKHSTAVTMLDMEDNGDE